MAERLSVEIIEPQHGSPNIRVEVRDLWGREDLAELTLVHLALALDATATLHPPTLDVTYEDPSVAASPKTQAVP